MNRMLKMVLTVGFLVLVMVQDSWSCAVCFGDPNAPIVHGAKAGVAVMLGIVGAVITGIVGVAIYWVRRAKMLEVQAALRGEDIRL